MIPDSIVFIVVYFGKWPRWFHAFLLSCKSNPSIDWLFFTDCSIPQDAPANVRFITTNIQQFNQLASSKTGMNIPIQNVRKLCDLKPAYGHIVEEYITNYAFWGFCDVDIIWGNIRKFITPGLLSGYDVITALENKVAGHFTIVRNNENGRLLYRQQNLFSDSFSLPQYQWFDEHTFTDIVRGLCEEEKIRVCWDKKTLDSGVESAAHQDYYLDRWLYEKGAVYSLDPSGACVKEYMYLHFLSWKSYMKCGELIDANRFYISYNNISSVASGVVVRFLNKIRRAVWGFHQRKRFNLWKRGFKRRWMMRFERWQFVTKKV